MLQAEAGRLPSLGPEGRIGVAVPVVVMVSTRQGVTVLLGHRSSC
jgi:hypothetical protein